MSNPAKNVVVVVPVRDFAKGLLRFLDGWRDGLKKAGVCGRFCVIDDGSAEPLADIVANDVAIVRHDSPQGLGACWRAAMDRPTPVGESDSPMDESILMIVPDYGYRPTDAAELLNVFKDVDMVIGVRPGQAPPGWLIPLNRLGRGLRKWLFGIPEMPAPPWYGWAGVRRRWAYRFRYGPKLQDPDGGLILVRRKILDRCPIQSVGGFANLELIAKANFLGAMIAEVAFSKPNDMPVMKGRFERIKNDEAVVFRRPEFRAEAVVIPPFATNNM